MDINDLIQRATADLEAAEAQLRAAEGRVKELTMIRDGLRFALQRYGGAQADDATPRVHFASADTGKALEGAAGITQTELVFNTLAAIGRPAKTQEVHAKLLGAGRKYKFEQVRGALGYLQRKRRINRVGLALWEVPAESAAPTNVIPAAEAAGMNTAGENGAASHVGVLAGAVPNSQPARQDSF